MYGRNGVDALSWALVVLEVVLSLLSAFIHVRGVSQALYFVSTALMFVVLLRIFSRDLARRQAENAKFLTWWTPKANAIRGPPRRQGAQIRPLLLRRILPRAARRGQDRADVPEVRQEKGHQNVRMKKIRPDGRIFL